MSIRPSDILFYGGGECFQKFGVPFMGMRSRHRIAPTFARSGAVGPFFDQNGVLRQASADRLRVQWQSGSPGLLLEPARTNPVLWNRDLTNAAWTKTNITAVKDQAGIDGGPVGSASKITATAGNGTCLQAITLASSARFQSCYVKRITGSGTINMTMDNGSTWTVIAVTSSWVRVTIPTQTLANPTVGFRIVTSGDAIAIDFVQNENGTAPSSPIATTTVAVTRNAETLSTPFAHPPQAMCGHEQFQELDAPTFADQRVRQIGASDNSDARLYIYKGSGLDRYVITHDPGSDVSDSVDINPSLNDLVDLWWWLYADGSVKIAASKNSGAITTGTQSNTSALASAWSGKLAHSGSVGATGGGSILLFRSLIARGSHHSTDDLSAALAA